MKNLIIYYSLEGNTKFIARKIARKTESKLLAINPLNDLNPDSFTRYIKGCFQALFRYKPALQEFKVQDNKYDTIFIGTPVWCNQMSPAVRSFLISNHIEVKNYALFCTYKIDKGITLKQMKKYLPEQKIIGKQSFKTPLKNKEKVEIKIDKWLNRINKNNHT
ncbi:MAG: flavodoxin family protein [Bacillota bacterium]